MFQNAGRVHKPGQRRTSGRTIATCDCGAGSDRLDVAGCVRRHRVRRQQLGALPITGTGTVTGGDGPALTGSLAWATWALFVGLAAMLAGAGLFGTLVGVRGDLEGFPVSVNGLISAAYYAGFLIGSRVALKALGQVGHIRVYAALASILAATILAFGLIVSPPAWVAMRFLTGLCLAGQYVVAESWLNQLTGNENRGRLLAVYGLVTMGAFGVGTADVRPRRPAHAHRLRGGRDPDLPRCRTGRPVGGRRTAGDRRPSPDDVTGAGAHRAHRCRHQPARRRRPRWLPRPQRPVRRARRARQR